MRSERSKVQGSIRPDELIQPDVLFQKTKLLEQLMSEGMNRFAARPDRGLPQPILANPCARSAQRSPTSSSPIWMRAIGPPKSPVPAVRVTKPVVGIASDS